MRRLRLLVCRPAAPSAAARAARRRRERRTGIPGRSRPGRDAFQFEGPVGPDKGVTRHLKGRPRRAPGASVLHGSRAEPCDASCMGLS